MGKGGGGAVKFHSLAELFPLIEHGDFTKLVDDIKTNGLREPIWLYEDQILDGRNRWRACEAAGVEPAFRTYTGADPVGFVVSLNLHRRHLTLSQRAALAARLETLKHGGTRQDANLHLEVSRARAAELLNVSERSVASASKVLEHGAPNLVLAVEQGEVSVSAAADVAELPKEEQREIVARGRKEILEKAKEIRLAEGERRRGERVEKIARMANPSPELSTSRRYAVIYADPPWKYEHNEADNRAIENHYPTMALEDIRALPVPDVCTSQAILFLWSTSPKLAEAMTVIDAWAFTYRTCAVWMKPQIGMGYYYRQQHELLLVATKGDMPVPAPADRPNSVITHDRMAHSVKPAVFREQIARMYPTLPKIELFARSAAVGWDTWGNEAQRGAA